MTSLAVIESGESFKNYIFSCMASTCGSSRNFYSHLHRQRERQPQQVSLNFQMLDFYIIWVKKLVVLVVLQHQQLLSIQYRFTLKSTINFRFTLKSTTNFINHSLVKGRSTTNFSYLIIVNIFNSPATGLVEQASSRH